MGIGTVGSRWRVGTSVIAGGRDKAGAGSMSGVEKGSRTAGEEGAVPLKANAKLRKMMFDKSSRALTFAHNAGGVVLQLCDFRCSNV